MKTVWIIGTLVVAAGGGAWYLKHPGSAAGAQYRLAKAEKGDLRVTVTATGTIQPVTLVQVGTQVTGTVQKLMADFNSKVTAGQVVAQIDPAPFQAHVDQDKANLVRAKADVERVRAALTQSEKELVRTQELAKQELVSASDLDAAVANHDSQAAQLQVAQATVAQCQATLESSQVNLNYTTIVSPINGTVVSRNVDVGQTVSASLSAPTLFVIADDLKKLQVQASVAEADIGRIAADQNASFTVDAYRDSRFRGRVAQIRLSPTTVQSVVTYTVILNAENPEEKLLPGMTANLSFQIEHLKDVLRIPNAALRFNPGIEVPMPPTATSGDTHLRRGEGRGGRGEDQDRRKQHHRVWILSEGAPKALDVEIGQTDGTFTQVAGGELKEGQEVIVGAAQEGASSSAMTNPFGPSFRGGGGGGGRR